MWSSSISAVQHNCSIFPFAEQECRSPKAAGDALGLNTLMLVCSYFSQQSLSSEAPQKIFPYEMCVHVVNIHYEEG